MSRPRLSVPLVVGDPTNLEAPDECPVCRFDSLLSFPLFALLPAGVSRAGRIARCLRCHTEARRREASDSPDC